MKWCAKCNGRLKPVKLLHYAPFDLWGLEILLNNVQGAQCLQCGNANLFLGASDPFHHIGYAVIRILLKKRGMFNDVLCDFACSYLGYRATNDALAAFWFGFESHDDVSDELSGDDFKEIIRNQYGHYSVREFYESVKAALAVVLPSDKFSSRVENGRIVIDLSPLLKEKQLVTEKKEKTQLEFINEFLLLFQLGELGESRFEEFVGANKGAVIVINDMGEGAVIDALVFVHFRRQEEKVFATNFLIHPKLLHSKELIASLFLRLLEYARERGAKSIFLEPPLQRSIDRVAQNLNFKKTKNSDFYQFKLVTQ